MLDNFSINNNSQEKIMHDLKNNYKLKRGRPKNPKNSENNSLINQNIQINLDSNEECKFEEQLISPLGEKYN